MLYAILCYNSEEAIASWLQDPALKPGFVAAFSCKRGIISPW